ncbi:hypothetical protein ACP4OV_026493 [Aristida adscensionis]
MLKRSRRTSSDPSRFSSSGEHTLRTCGHEQWRDWANLPSELTEQIASRLLRHDVSEYLRLRAACKGWRHCTADPRGLDTRFRPRRWIMLSNCDGERRRFLNLSTGACAHVDLPELSGHHMEGSTEGLLVLRDKLTDAIRVLNPLTRSLTELPPATAALRSVSPEWRPEWPSLYPSRIMYAAISDETSPPTVALFMRGHYWNIAYAKPGDEHWALVDDKAWKYFPSNNPELIREDKMLKFVWFLSTMTVRGRVYFATYQGNILELRLSPRPRLVPVIIDDDDDDRGVLMVRYYCNINHLSPAEQRRAKRRKKTNLLKLPGDRRGRFEWNQLDVFEVDLAGKKLVPTESVGQRAVFVGDVACISVSARRFPSVYGNAVYLGMNSHCTIPCGVCHLEDHRIEPRLEFGLEAGGRAPLGMDPHLLELKRAVPLARPCRLEEYLVCHVGYKNGIND